MINKGSIIADEIINEWRREKYYKELWYRRNGGYNNACEKGKRTDIDMERQEKSINKEVEL